MAGVTVNTLEQAGFDAVGNGLKCIPISCQVVKSWVDEQRPSGKEFRDGIAAWNRGYKKADDLRIVKELYAEGWTIAELLEIGYKAQIEALELV